MLADFSLHEWSAWAPGLESVAAWKSWSAHPFSIPCDGEPALPGVPPMLRRRADRFGRMALRVACDVLGAARGVPVVFVSRHGSLGRSAALLGDLAAAVPLSPASFASSVHNASTGLLGIARADTAPCAALAAGDARIAAMLAEVIAFLSDGHPRVLGVLCDEPPPELYQRYIATDEPPLAWAGMFGAPSAEGENMSFSAGAAELAPGNPSLAWIKWLLSEDAEFGCPGTGAVSGWKVQRRA
ncbi:beta-ketoacyl synthase chain length factor [Niveibacterium terrae]|uniref:beta-ketoacyl synthase chain length factor n=1 Tax=Niveibacterium terrae TaxID=3373598 RepID=UPI003A95866A